jgi:hypothetical protein
VPNGYKYTEILGVTRRFYEKLERIHKARPIEKQWETYRDLYRDDAYAFFLFCYHIKDWIKNGPAVDGSTKSAVEAYINQNNCLKFCADIANGIKHLNLDKLRSQSRPQFTSEEMIMRADGRKKKPNSNECAEVTVETNGYIVTDEGRKEIFELATECLKAWELFFSQHSIA